jgi:hypothetical protein
VRFLRVLAVLVFAAAIHQVPAGASETENSSFRWSKVASLDADAAIQLATSALLKQKPELSGSRLEPLSVSINYEPWHDAHPSLIVVLVDTTAIPPGTAIMADVPHYYVKLPSDGGGEPTIEAPHGVWEAPTSDSPQ